MDFISPCNVGLIYDLSFKNVLFKTYLGRDVGRGRAVTGRAAGREGLPQAPQALMLLFMLTFYFISLYLFILIIE
jgi:hypothetical protein